MRFEIEHTTVYHYDTPVNLGQHTLRLRPRDDGTNNLLHFEYAITPTPTLCTEVLDAEGNVVTHIWFTGETSQLTIASSSRLQTTRTNAFDYLVDPQFQQLPAQYPPPLPAQLSCYLNSTPYHQTVVELANELAIEAEGKPVQFLKQVTAYLHHNIKHEVRHFGAPQTPEATLALQKGACRDTTVLFMALCRVQGLAARFVSGYQATPAHEDERRYMHAWPEVFIPGGGWRGYDPSHNLAVADRHIAVASACDPLHASPIEGSFSGDASNSEMSVLLRINTT